VFRIGWDRYGKQGITKIGGEGGSPTTIIGN